MIKMRDDFQKAESILAMHIRIERIDLNAYLHLKTFQARIACDATANEVIRRRSMYSCTVRTDRTCDQECYKMLTS